MLIAVVLPAPLGPKNPRISPVLISRSSESTATFVPKAFVSLTVRTTVLISAFAIRNHLLDSCLPGVSALSTMS